MINKLTMTLMGRSKKTEYCVVNARTICGLEEKVNQLISKGWSVQGGVSHTVVAKPKSYDHEPIECWSQSLTRETITSGKQSIPTGCQPCF